MARYTGSKLKLSRRVGVPIADIPKHTSGERVRTSLGMHGDRGRRLRDYGVRLNEKQKLRHHYGVLERQFRRIVTEASRQSGKAGAKIAAIASSLVLLGSVARAQPPNHGLDFVEVGDPGNRPANQREAPYLHPPHLDPPWRIGRVPYRYRITRTEVTVSQWFEFVEAYAPYWQGPRTASEFTGDFISPSNTSPTEPPGYFIEPGAEEFPTNMGWRMAARFCNWLHNDKATERWAFDSGAYDTSTFTANPNGTLNDQRTHLPGARFWIPTNDEWTKALHYDPDRYGTTSGGYWVYPHRSDTPPVPGLPGTPGAQTNAGTIPNDPGFFYPVGSYPDVQSPWGLLDGSGGVKEWTEHAFTSQELRDRVTRGSFRRHPLHEYDDRLDVYRSAPPWAPAFTGLRIASAVPAPSSVVPFTFVMLALLKTRRQ